MCTVGGVTAAVEEPVLHLHEGVTHRGARIDLIPLRHTRYYKSSLLTVSPDIWPPDSAFSSSSGYRIYDFTTF